MRQNKRKEEREPCYGKLLFLNQEIPGYIRDISENGMRVNVPRPFIPQVNPLDTYKVQILPEGETVFEPFSAEIEIRWIRTDPLFTTIGASLRGLEPGKEGAYNHLLELYRSHSSAEG